MKKKIAIVFISIFSIIILALIIIPTFFKEEIKDEILRYANKNLEGEIKIEDYDLSLISSFPEFNFNFEGVKVLDIEKNEILNIENINAKINSKDFILDNTISVQSIVIEKPKIHYRILRDTLENEDIRKGNEMVNASESIDESNSADDGSSLKFNINSYEIVEGFVWIKDEVDNTVLKITNLNHSGFGVYQGQILKLNTTTFIDDINIRYGNTLLMDKTKIEGQFNLVIDFEEEKYTLNDNNLKINNIELNWVGIIKKIDDSFDIDLKFNTPNTKFEDLLALIPEQFKKDIDKVETNGKFNIEGSIEGIYSDNMLPGFNINTKVIDASVKYPELPETVKNINFSINLTKPNVYGLDKLILDISNVNAKIADNSISGRMNIEHLMTDPFINATFFANADLSKLKEALPIEKDENLKGIVKADIKLKGKLSDLENEAYDKFDASGSIILKDFIYTSNYLKDKIFISDANITVSPQYLSLNKFNFKLGKSDIKAVGKVSKYLEYFMKGNTLSGALDIKSNNFYISDFVTKESATENINPASDSGVAVKEASTTSKAEGESSKFEMDVVHVPANINFENKISIDNFYYGAIKATKLKGSVGLKDQKAYFNKVSMAMFDGAINLNGNYSSKDSLAPKVDFDLKLNKIDVEKLSRTIKFVDKLAPIAKSATGKISANIDISTTLDTKMNPVYNTMYSGGNIRTTNLSLKNTDFLNDLADVLNVEELKKNPKVEDVNLKYKMEKGIMKISPFDIRILDIKSTIVGSTDVGKETLDMDVSMIFPRKYLSKDANDIINGAVSLANTFGAKVSIGETIDVNAKIDGDIKSPDYSLTYGPDKSKTPEEYLKKEADKIIEDTKKSAGKDLEKKATNFINNLFK